MANLKDTADNGTLLALGLVGVVAAAGAVVQRGSGSADRATVLERIKDHLNGVGLDFQELRWTVPGFGKYVDILGMFTGVYISQGRGKVEVIKVVQGHDGKEDMRILGEFAPNDFDGITRVVRKNMPKTRAVTKRVRAGAKGSRSMSQIKSSGLRDLSSLDKGEFFKLKPTAKKVYRKGDYVRSERKYEALDTDDISRALYLRGSTRVFVDFEY